MRPQKPKKRIHDQSKIFNRFQGYYLDDVSCQYFCVNYRGKKRGCILSACEFEEEKMDAIKHGKIKRKGRSDASHPARSCSRDGDVL